MKYIKKRAPQNSAVKIKTAPSDAFFSGLIERIQKSRKADADENSVWRINSDEGQLAVDVAHNNKELVIMATIAGARPEDISINICNDLLTIRGRRHHEQELNDDDYFYRECFWGSFSRTVILPVDVLTDAARATLQNGVLTIRIPKANPFLKVPLKVIED